MIIGDFTNFQIDIGLLSPRIVEALTYIRSITFEDMEDGVYPAYEEGMYMVVKRIETTPFAEVKAEKHQQYIDIHYMISGVEKIGFARETGDNTSIVVTPHVEDHTFFDEVEHEIELVLNPGQFAIFAPSDIHRPWCLANESSYVRKALLKVPLPKKLCEFN